MDERAVELPYAPREPFLPYHERHQRFAAIVAHRRAGKTVACVNDLVASAVTTNKKRAHYSYIAPFYAQAKAVAWDYLKEYTAPLNPKTSESELSVIFPHNQAKVRLFGADNADALRGIYNDGVIMDEYGMTRPSVWPLIVLPTLADRTGWATFIGTPAGKNHFWEICEHAKAHPDDWFYLSLKASETDLLSAFELAEQRRLMDEDEYDQEYECSFDAAIRGSVFGKELRQAEEEGRVSADHRMDSSQPCHVAFDLGFTDDTAMWFWQPKPNNTYLLTYAHSEHFQEMDYYINRLLSLPNLGTVYLPHDARAKSLQTGRSIVEQFLAAGIRPSIVPDMHLRDGISAARKLLPYCYFSLPGTREGVEALKQYQRPWDENTHSYRDRPQHDWTSHYADAFRYFALSCRPPSVQRTKVISGPPRSKSYTLDNLFADAQARKRTLGRRVPT